MAVFAYIHTADNEQAHTQGILPVGIQLSDGELLYVLRDADGEMLGYSSEYGAALRAALRDYTLVTVH